MAAIYTDFDHISAHRGYIIVLLVAIPRVLGVDESSGTIIYTYKFTKAHLAAILFFKWPLIQPILDICLCAFGGYTQVLGVDESSGTIIYTYKFTKAHMVPFLFFSLKWPLI